MKRPYLYLFFFILIISNSNAVVKLTNQYCVEGDNCNLLNLSVQNLQVTKYINATVTDFNITGCITYEDGTKYCNNTIHPNNNNFSISGNLTATNLYLDNRIIINNTILNISHQLVKGDILYYSGLSINSFPRPSGFGSFTLTNTNVGALTWSPPVSSTVPTWANTLQQGHITGTNNATITDNTRLYIGTAETGYIYPNGGNIGIKGNIEFDNGNSLEVPNDEYAFFSKADNDAGLFFNFVDKQFELRNTANNVNLLIDALGSNNAGVIKPYLTIGGEGTGGMASGDINVSTVFYDTLTAKSPHFECETKNNLKYCNIISRIPDGIQFNTNQYQITFDDNYTILWNDIRPDPTVKNKIKLLNNKTVDEKNWKMYRDICQSNLYHLYSSLNDYLIGNHTCTYYQDWADSDCIERFDKFYYYNNKTQKCEKDNILYCERIIWQVWRGNQCVINPQLECLYNQTDKYWNFSSGICETDQQRICESNGCGYIWDGTNCTINKRQYNYCKSQECDRNQYWDGNNCINI